MAQVPPPDQHLTYQLQFRKCGKASCGTCRNGQGHGPYWYAYWRVKGKLCSVYIGKDKRTPVSSEQTTPQQEVLSAC
jgi:hypothetical protein